MTQLWSWGLAALGVTCPYFISRKWHAWEFIKHRESDQ